MPKTKLPLNKWMQLEYTDNHTYKHLIDIMFNKLVMFITYNNIHLYIDETEFKTKFINYLYKYSKIPIKK